MTAEPVLWSLDDRGVARVVLNRPDVGNAYDGAMLDGLHRAMDALGRESALRVVVIAGAGKQFQAGADLTWLLAVKAGNRDANVAASRATAEAIDRFNRLPCPTVALVHGFCIGGGTGLIAAADIVIAANDARFAISEVRWGLTAAIIIPQLNDAISVRQVRRYALTGERFGAEDARRIGLVHEIVPEADLQSAGERIISLLLANGPQAMAETKACALAHASGDLSAATLSLLIDSHATKRMSDEAGEGLLSFKEKRAARWS